MSGVMTLGGKMKLLPMPDISPSNEDCIEVGNDIGLLAVTEPVKAPSELLQLLFDLFKIGGIPGSVGGGVDSFGLGGVDSVRNFPNVS